jgi:hypothetical protein
MINPINITICKILDHKLFMLDEFNVDVQINEYNGQHFVYCMRCKAYLPIYDLE